MTLDEIESRHLVSQSHVQLIFLFATTFASFCFLIAIYTRMNINLTKKSTDYYLLQKAGKLLDLDLNIAENGDDGDGDVVDDGDVVELIVTKSRDSIGSVNLNFQFFH